MKASELIEELQKLIDEHGDHDILLSDDPNHDRAIVIFPWEEERPYSLLDQV